MAERSGPPKPTSSVKPLGWMSHLVVDSLVRVTAKPKAAAVTAKVGDVVRKAVQGTSLHY